MVLVLHVNFLAICRWPCGCLDILHKTAVDVEWGCLVVPIEAYRYQTARSQGPWLLESGGTNVHPGAARTVRIRCGTIRRNATSAALLQYKRL